MWKGLYSGQTRINVGASHDYNKACVAYQQPDTSSSKGFSVATSMVINNDSSTTSSGIHVKIAKYNDDFYSFTFGAVDKASGIVWTNNVNYNDTDKSSTVYMATSDMTFLDANGDCYLYYCALGAADKEVYFSNFSEAYYNAAKSAEALEELRASTITAINSIDKSLYDADDATTITELQESAVAAVTAAEDLTTITDKKAEFDTAIAAISTLADARTSVETAIAAIDPTKYPDDEVETVAAIKASATTALESATTKAAITAVLTSLNESMATHVTKYDAYLATIYTAEPSADVKDTTDNFNSTAKINGVRYGDEGGSIVTSTASYGTRGSTLIQYDALNFDISVNVAKLSVQQGLLIMGVDVVNGYYESKNGGGYFTMQILKSDEEGNYFITLNDGESHNLSTATWNTETWSKNGGYKGRSFYSEYGDFDISFTRADGKVTVKINDYDAVELDASEFPKVGDDTKTYISFGNMNGTGSTFAIKSIKDATEKTYLSATGTFGQLKSELETVESAVAAGLTRETYTQYYATATGDFSSVVAHIEALNNYVHSYDQNYFANRIAAVKEAGETFATKMGHADSVVNAINQLGTIGVDSKDDIELVDTLMETLTDEEKALVTNIDVLTSAKAAYTSAVNVKAVEDKIAAIGDVTIDSKAVIDEARAAYDALTDAEKTMVTTLDTLTTAETTYTAKVNAKAVDDKIAAIGDVTISSKTTIEEARTAYDALSDAAKAMVTKLETLTTAETAYETEVNKAAANEVIAKIEAIGEVTVDSKDIIAEARSAYDSLSDEAKAMVTNAVTLTTAETTYDSLTTKSKGGCGGSIVATSALVFALAATSAVVISKRRKED